MHPMLRNSTQIYQEDVRIRAVSGKDFRIVQNDEEVVSIGPRGHQQRRALLGLPSCHNSA